MELRIRFDIPSRRFDIPSRPGIVALLLAALTALLFAAESPAATRAKAPTVGSVSP
jgi:hypothetical protein